MAPTIIIVHATKAYDRPASAKYGINRTLEKCRPAMLLEIGDGMNRSYLGLPRIMQDKDRLPGSGMFLDPRFFRARIPWFKTNDFVFLGGRVNRCLTNAFLSTLLFKLHDPDSLFANPNCGMQFIMNNGRNALLAQRGERKEETSLNFHFNFEGSYGSETDFQRLISDVYWSPNMPHMMMAESMASDYRMLAASGWNIKQFANGAEYKPHALVGTRENKRIISLYYWTDTNKLAETLMPQSGQ